MNARGQYVVQVSYATNNPAAPPMFYQCSDVFIVWYAFLNEHLHYNDFLYLIKYSPEKACVYQQIFQPILRVSADSNLDIRLTASVTLNSLL